jgi:hypothetical protein
VEAAMNLHLVVYMDVIDPMAKNIVVSCVVDRNVMKRQDRDFDYMQHDVDIILEVGIDGMHISKNRFSTITEGDIIKSYYNWLSRAKDL